MSRLDVLQKLIETYADLGRRASIEIPLWTVTAWALPCQPAEPAKALGFDHVAGCEKWDHEV